MSIRLFHARTRLVVRMQSGERSFTWYAFHRRRVDWHLVLTPALALVGFVAVSTDGGISFGDGGSIDWTRDALWTTIRLRLPPCSDRKAALLAAGLLKAARYGEGRTKESSVWQA
jgi:hypothetical protein